MVKWSAFTIPLAQAISLEPAAPISDSPTPTWKDDYVANLDRMKADLPYFRSVVDSIDPPAGVDAESRASMHERDPQQNNAQRSVDHEYLELGGEFYQLFQRMRPMLPPDIARTDPDLVEVMAELDRGKEKIRSLGFRVDSSAEDHIQFMVGDTIEFLDRKSTL